MTSTKTKPEIGQWVYALDDEFSNNERDLRGSTGKVVVIHDSQSVTSKMLPGGKEVDGWAVEVEFYLLNKKTDPIFIEQHKYERHLEEIEASDPRILYRPK